MTTRYAPTTTEIVEMFTDRTPNEATKYNRLMTQEEDNGNTALIAYGWQKIAVYDESRELVTVFTGHASDSSPTVNNYLNMVVDIAEERGREVVASGETPTDGQPPGIVGYIREYISFTDKSAVERNAQKEVEEALSQIA
jgi:hypothetical protein